MEECTTILELEQAGLHCGVTRDDPSMLGRRAPISETHFFRPCDLLLIANYLRRYSGVLRMSVGGC
jgi:hypothetical protein